METPYRAVSFVKHDIITRSTLDQLQQNYQWVNDNTPRGRFDRGGANPRVQNLVILSGKKEIQQNTKSDSASVSVGFGKAFAPNCHPAVTTGINADFQRRIFCSVTGPGGNSYPNNTGCVIKVNIAADAEVNDNIKKNFFVHWSAMGFREDSLNEF